MSTIVEQVQGQLLQQLPYIMSVINSGKAQVQQRSKLLKTLAGLVLVYGLNKTLSAIARNHWRLRKQGVAWNMSDEVAIVTGGCSGFGFLTVQGLASRLHKVIVLDVSDLPPELDRLPNVVYYKCDITNAETVHKTVSEIRRAHGIVTILVNNAGIAASHTILDTPPEYLEKLFKVNVLSHWYLIQALLPQMLEAKKGHILALASMASYASTANLVDYCATKHAVLALHDGLNQELKHRYTNGRCIQTSIVHPMWARTPLVGTWNSALTSTKTPVLEPHVVADAVGKQILSGTSGQVYLPGKYGAVSGVHGWPHWFQELLRDGNQAATDTRLK